MLDCGVDIFEWDEANIRHIAAHGVSVEEAEQALTLAPLELDSYDVDGELRFEDLGQTASGRILKLLYVIRDVTLIRVVTAYDATARAKRVYLQSRMML